MYCMQCLLRRHFDGPWGSTRVAQELISLSTSMPGVCCVLAVLVCCRVLFLSRNTPYQESKAAGVTHNRSQIDRMYALFIDCR